MKIKSELKRAGFVFGLASYIVLLIGAVVRASNTPLGNTILLTAMITGAIHWMIAIIDVWKDPVLKDDERSRYFWLATVIMIPPIGGMIYYIVDKKRIRT